MTGCGDYRPTVTGDARLTSGHYAHPVGITSTATKNCSIVVCWVGARGTNTILLDREVAERHEAAFVQSCFICKASRIHEE